MARPFESMGIPENFERDPQTTRLLEILKPLIDLHGEKPVLEYIEKNTDKIAPDVIKKWRDQGQKPTTGIVTAVLSVLEHFPPNALPVIKKFSTNEPALKRPTARKSVREERIKNNAQKLKAMVDDLKKEGKII